MTCMPPLVSSHCTRTAPAYGRLQRATSTATRVHPWTRITWNVFIFLASTLTAVAARGCLGVLPGLCPVQRRRPWEPSGDLTGDLAAQHMRTLAAMQAIRHESS